MTRAAVFFALFLAACGDDFTTSGNDISPPSSSEGGAVGDDEDGGDAEPASGGDAEPASGGASSSGGDAEPASGGAMPKGTHPESCEVCNGIWRCGPSESESCEAMETRFAAEFGSTGPGARACYCKVADLGLCAIASASAPDDFQFIDPAELGQNCATVMGEAYASPP